MSGIVVSDGWEVKTFSEIALINMGQSPESEFVNENQKGLPFLQGNAEFGNINPQELYWVTVPKKIANKDDILISVRAPVGDMNVADKSYCIGRGLAAITVNKIDKLFGLYILFQERIQLNRLAQGSTFLAISKNDFEKLLIKIPKEKKEQEKIAKILSALDKNIENTSKIIEKEKNIKKALMQELLANGIDKNAKIRSPKTHSYKQSKLGLIPEEWEVVSLGEITKAQQGLQIAISDRKENISKKSYPYITIQYLKHNKVVEYIEEPKKSVLCNHGDILMTRTGNTGVVVTNAYGVFHNNFFKIDFDRNKIDKTFFVYFLESPKVQLEIELKAGVTTIPDLNHSDFYSINFMMIDIEEQKQIAKILKTQDKKIESEQKNLSKLQELKKGLMSDLLSGKVRVEI